MRASKSCSTTAIPTVTWWILPLTWERGWGPSSLELCVMSHAGCYVTILALVAKKMHLTLKGAKVKVEAVKSDETGTVSEETFDITLKIDAPQDRVERLHKLTLETCPVGLLFEKAGVKISYKLNVTKE